MVNVSNPTDLQQAILYTVREHPRWSNAEVADHVGCSDSYVSNTLEEYDTSILDTIDNPTTADEVDHEPSEYGSGTQDGIGLVEMLVLMLILWVVGWKVGIVPAPGEVLTTAIF
ncbi:hypothetical protein [Halosimplex halobium]|uniref:hypothetical protein n=1 Tax=Halosimplex halobium TaxID=3396618 RepID=UPI003F556D54